MNVIQRLTSVPLADRLNAVPPRFFWPTLLAFFRYAFRQASLATRRETGSREFVSHLHYKHAHYLEKAMLCEYPRSPELDASHAALKAYVASPEGQRDDSRWYLRKLIDEYEQYPSGFRCYMLDVPLKPRPPEDAQIVRRVIVQRRSIRSFDRRPLSADLLKKVVEAGSYAPTSCNAQPVSFLTLDDRATIDAVFGAADGARDWKDQIPTGILVLTDRRHYKPFQQHLVMFQDVAAATQNCLLMAEALGLAACWVSLLTDAHMDDQSEIYARLGLPEHMVIGAAIAIGHPVNAVCHVPRRHLSNVWHHGRFGRSRGE